MEWLAENWIVIGPIVGVVVGSALPGPQTKMFMGLLNFLVRKNKK